MDTSIAAENCREFVEKSETLSDTQPAANRSHLNFMIDEIVSGRVAGEKSHRWLGYMQGVLVATGSATLEEMKSVNIEA